MFIILFAYQDDNTKNRQN